jgi:2,3-bisphosphoglycerate-dependent phosphoglycerate mutase
MIVALLRHGRTAWNDQGRMQGRADVPLSDAGREQVRRWRLPASLATARLVASPLLRARETAALLGAEPVAVDDALIEMDWGEWEGESLGALKAGLGAAFEATAGRGLDFRPPGGESPREIQQRIVDWLLRTSAQATPLVAVTHQGVIRSVLALTTAWDMVGRPPVRLADDVVHLIEFRNGRAQPVEWNVPLMAGPIGRRNPPAVLR